MTYWIFPPSFLNFFLFKVEEKTPVPVKMNDFDDLLCVKRLFSPCLKGRLQFGGLSGRVKADFISLSSVEVEA